MATNLNDATNTDAVNPAAVTQEAKDAAAANQAHENKAAQIRDALMARTANNAERIREAYSSADRAAASRGFEDTLDASKAVGIDYDFLSVWYPARSTKNDVSQGELCIRQLHNSAHPTSSPDTQAEFKRLFNLAINASDEASVTEARRLSKDAVYLRDFTATPGLVTEDDCRKSLEKRVQDMRDNGQSNEAVAFVADFVAAINDPQGLAKLARRLNAMQTAANRWRSTLFLNLFGDKIANRLTVTNSMGVSTTPEWLTVCNAVQAAHAKYMREQGKKIVVASELENVLVKAVDDTLDTVSTKGNTIKVPTRDEKVTAAKDSLYRAVRNCVRFDLISEEDADNIRELFAVKGMDESPEQAKERADAAKAEKARKEREAKAAEAAAKAAAPKEAKPAKAPVVATPEQTREERLAAARALIAAAEAGEELPPVAPVAAAKPKAPKKGGFKTAKPVAAAPASDEPSIEEIMAE